MRNLVVRNGYILFFLLFFCITPWTLLSQEDAGGTEAALDETSSPRRMVVYFMPQPPAGFSERERILLYESLILSLSRASDDVLLLESPMRGGPPDIEDKNNLTLELTGDAWMTVSVSGSMESLSVSVETYDLVTREEFAGRFGPFEEVEYRDLERRFWEPLEELPGRLFHRVSNKTKVTFTGVPGTKVYGFTEEAAVIDESGRLEFNLGNPSLFDYRAEIWNYYPVEGEFYLEQEPVEIDLAQEAGTRIGFDVYLYNLCFPSVNFIFYIVPNYFFVKAGITSYMIGLHLGSDSDESTPPVFPSIPLNDIGIQIGTYINKEDQFIRLYGGIGAFTRLIVPEGFFGLDPLMPFGAYPIVGVEMSSLLKLRFFLEYTPTFYYSPRPDWFLASTNNDGDMGIFIPLEVGAIDFLVFRVGVRILL